MDPIYRPDDYEIKLMVMYAIKKLKRSPSYTVLGQIITESANVSYFEIQQFIRELLDLGNIEDCRIDESTVYMLTKAGEDACEFFAQRIPANVRRKIDDAAYKVNNDKSDENKVYADYIPINMSEYKVRCGILENNIRLIDFEMYAGSKERAKKICEYFKEHTQEFYLNILNFIEENTDN